MALKDVKAFLVQHEVDYADIFERSELIARYDAVRAHITKLAEQRLRAQANRAVQRGSHELAVRLYTDALQLDGVSPELQSQLVANRSAAYLALGLASDALADALRAVELDPGHVKAFYRRGMAELALRRWPEAAASFESALELVDAAAGCAAKADESDAERARTAAFRDALATKLDSARAWESTSKLGACALGALAELASAPEPARAADGAGESEGFAESVALLRKLDDDLLSEVFSHLRVRDVCAAAPACAVFGRAAASQLLWQARSRAAFAGEVEPTAGGTRDWRVFYRERRRRVVQWADGAPLAIASLAGHQSRQPIYGVSVAADLCASSSEDGTVLLRDLGSAGRGVLMTCSHGAGTLGVWLAPSGRRLASGGFDSTLKLWSLPRWDSAAEAVAGGAAAAMPRVERCLLAHSAPIVSVLGFGGDEGGGGGGGVQLLSTGFDGTLRHWDWERGALLATRDAHAGHASSVARDEASATVYSGGDDGRVRAWDLRTDGPAVDATTEAAGIDGAVWAIATSPAGGGHQIAAGATGGSLCLWDSRAGFSRGPLESIGAAHTDAVAGLQFVNGGRCLVSSSFDSTLRLWDSPFYAPPPPPAAAVLDGHERFYGAARAQPLSGTWGPPRQTIRSAQLSRCTRIAADDLRIVVGCIGMPLAVVEML